MSRAGAAVRLGDGHAQQAELGRLADQLGEREAAARVELLGDRRDRALGELAHGVAKGAVLVGKVVVHRGDHTSEGVP